MSPSLEPISQKFSQCAPGKRQTLTTWSYFSSCHLNSLCIHLTSVFYIRRFSEGAVALIYRVIDLETGMIEMPG